MSNTIWNRIKKMKKRRIVLAVIFIALIIFRMYLPTLVKNYVNKVLSEIPGYHGSITDVDIALYRGAYVIKGLDLINTNATSDIQLMSLPRNDISIEWRALFSGNIVAEIYLYDPELNYVVEDMVSDNSDDEDWTKALTDLVPIEINHLVIENGKMAYIELAADPQIDLSVRNLQFDALNLRNVKEDERTLPSPISGSGISLGGGNLTLNGKMNMLKQIPDADINIKLESISLPAFNDVSSEYAKMDFESGNVNAYSELALADGNITGYFKVLFNEVKFLSEEDDFLETIWEGVASFFEFILQNQNTENFAVKAPIAGQVDNLNFKTWPTIGSIFRNAFIQGFKSEIDQEVEYQDAFLKEQKDSLKWFQFKKKKELRDKMKEQEEEKAEGNE